MTYRDFKGVRYHEGELLIPIVFKAKAAVEQIDRIVVFDHVIPSKEKNNK